MVTQKSDILKVLQNHDIQNLDIDVLNKFIKEYPYFQVIWALKTKWLKQKKTYIGSVLQQTAARTIDRKILYEFVELKNKKQPVKSTSQVVPPVPVKSIPKETITKKPVSLIEIETEKKGKPEIPKKEVKQKRSYIEWLKAFKEKNTPIKKQKNTQIDLVEKFLKERPKIVPKKNVSVKPPDIIEKSIVEKQMLMTETLANLYVKQKKYDKAIQAFRILSLKYPKKSSYFANQIKEIKQNLK